MESGARQQKKVSKFYFKKFRIIDVKRFTNQKLLSKGDGE